MIDFNLWTDETYKSTNLFQSMYVRGEFRRNFNEIRVQKGDMIFENGNINHLYYVHTGTVFLGIQYEGTQRIIQQLVYPFYIFGEQIIDESRSPFQYAEALEDSILFVMSREELVKICRRDRKAIAFLVASVSEKFQNLLNQFTQIVYYSVERRIAQFLLDYANKKGTPTEEGLFVEHPFNQNIIAEFTYCSRQSVSSCIRRLKQMGLLEFGRKSFVIFKPEAFKNHLKTI